MKLFIAFLIAVTSFSPAFAQEVQRLLIRGDQMLEVGKTYYGVLGTSTYDSRQAQFLVDSIEDVGNDLFEIRLYEYGPIRSGYVKFLYPRLFSPFQVGSEIDPIDRVCNKNFFK